MITAPGYSITESIDSGTRTLLGIAYWCHDLGKSYLKTFLIFITDQTESHIGNPNYDEIQACRQH
ncbi:MULTISPECIES: hypothetical protein [unclassified Moorena]|uniref:hypothetical protein n=1 Tax=unclassified Moorena TaxID=2683338 RepID=UPI001400BC62|nr:MULTISPECIES: hypothetical protein [unclassified Moorena]NEO15565.1 hypothetical protein [Moorena sp. SIO3E8]NEP98991.1 hypothetical protein [Moorena sp. SIO3F7]